MLATDRPIVLATRGSALALAQANLVLGQCRAGFPGLQFDIKIIKTTGDKLQTAPPDVPGMAGTKGLFTKELEVALLNGDADLAIHSLKDLPTELPDGLELCAVLPRADVRDLLICRDAGFGSRNAPVPEHPQRQQRERRGLNAGQGIRDFPPGATIATSSTRRQAQVLALRPDLKVVPIRGNVGTRLQKLADRTELDGLVLAAAGLERLRFQIAADGRLGVEPGAGDTGKVPLGLRATFLSVEEMIPCVGQGAIGIEGRIGDGPLGPLFARLNDAVAFSCVTAERSFLHAMGGGCLSPVAAYAEAQGGQIRIRAVSFREPAVRRSERRGGLGEAAELGARVAADLRG